MADYAATQLQRTREDLEFMLEFAEASLLVGDDRVFEEFFQWLRPLLKVRRVPSAAVDITLVAVHELAGGELSALIERCSAASLQSVRPFR